MEGDIVKEQLTISVASPELLMRGGVGGWVLREGEGRDEMIAGEGGEI